MNIKHTVIFTLIIYCIVFYTLWAFVELIITPQISLLDNDLFETIIKTVLIKNIVWTGPAFLLIKYFKDDVYVSLKDMFFNTVNWLKYLPVFAFFTIYILVASCLLHGGIFVSPDFTYSTLIIVLFVGISEELVFRGWLLNATVKGCSKKQMWLMLILNAMLFLFIHFPIWIYEKTLFTNFKNMGFLCIIVLGIVFGRAFIKTKNIMVPISLHMYWDFLMFIFV
ncbi:CPBP family intramembrane metalloprotease [Oscillospiraceae bacterium CM]|nr:CPBP family intramembrane metalloprotease [Oscillospiraceae bacterium CM]